MNYMTLWVEASHSKLPLVHWSSASGDITYLICRVTSQGHVVERSCKVLGRTLYSKLPPCQIWLLKALWNLRYDFFSLSRDLARPHDSKIM